MKTNRALIVIDVQKDFCTGGSLAVPEGDTIVPIINNLLQKFDLVIFTKDWHTPDMYAFESYQKEHFGKKAFDKYINEQGKEDTIWPDHCVENTEGAEFHPDLDFGKCKKDFYIFKKGNMPHYHPYSGFGEVNEEGQSELDVFLRERNINELFIAGLAGDYCCKETAIDSVNLGYKTFIMVDAIKSIGPQNFKLYKEYVNDGIHLMDTKNLEYLFELCM